MSEDTERSRVFTDVYSLMGITKILIALFVLIIMLVTCVCCDLCKKRRPEENLPLVSDSRFRRRRNHSTKSKAKRTTMEKLTDLYENTTPDFPDGPVTAMNGRKKTQILKSSSESKSKKSFHIVSILKKTKSVHFADEVYYPKEITQETDSSFNKKIDLLRLPKHDSSSNVLNYQPPKSTTGKFKVTPSFSSSSRPNFPRMGLLSTKKTSKSILTSSSLSSSLDVSSTSSSSEAATASSLPETKKTTSYEPIL